jgi:hypothetical protein
MRDLCLIQATLTMIKSQQLIDDNLLDLFIDILFSIINFTRETIESSQIIAAARNSNLWVIKLLYVNYFVSFYVSIML